MLKKAWYILNYHDISWEENPYIVGIGGTFPPDIFAEHLEALSHSGKLVSIQEGFKRFKEGSIDEPLISFWFDDGFLGVRKYAMPLMEQYGIQGAVAINSRFTLRQEMFWRLKLSYLSRTDGLKFLRNRLKPFGCTINQSLKAFTMDHFSLEIVDIIDEVYQEFTREIDREDTFRIFDTLEGIATLHQNGWEISNHSAAHYPVSEDSHIHYFADEFLECENAIGDHLDIESKFWVLPFDRKSVDEDTLLQVFQNADTADRHLVLLGDKANQDYCHGKKLIYRIGPPELRGEGLVKYLASI